MKRATSIGIITAALVAAVPAGGEAQDRPPQQMIGTAIMCNQNGCVESRPNCTEDQACWVWSRMGNRKRGVTINGKRLVLGPCGFSRAYRKHQLTDLLPLKGDHWAIQHGCQR